MIFTIIGILILLYSIIDYKKALMIYIAYKLFLVTNITVFSFPGIPILTVEDFLNISFAIIYIFFSRKKNIKVSMPFKTPFVVMALSVLISAIFSVAGFTVEITFWVRMVFENFILVYIVWNQIDNENDFKYIFKLITLVMFCSCIYGLIEYFIQANPLVEFEKTLISDTSKIVDGRYAFSNYRGYRIQSFFEHAIGAGMCWGTYFSFCLSYFLNKRKKMPYDKFAKVTMILCLICIFLTKMRSVYFFTFIALLGALNFRKKKTYILLFLGIVSIFIFLYCFDTKGYFLALFNSIFTGQSLGGSSYTLRLKQLDVVLKLFSKSPICGLGSKYQSVMNASVLQGLYGSESIWFHILPCYGLFGVIAWSIYYYYLVIKVPKFYKTKSVFFISLAYVLTYSITTIPGYKNIVLFLYIFYFIKTSQKYKCIRYIDQAGIVAIPVTYRGVKCKK